MHCLHQSVVTYLSIIDKLVFLTAFSIRVSLLSSKIHNVDDTPKYRHYLYEFFPRYINPFSFTARQERR